VPDLRLWPTGRPEAAPLHRRGQRHVAQSASKAAAGNSSSATSALEIIDRTHPVGPLLMDERIAPAREGTRGGRM
jgi:hypothetical protein